MLACQEPRQPLPSLWPTRPPSLPPTSASLQLRFLCFLVCMAQSPTPHALPVWCRWRLAGISQYKVKVLRERIRGSHAWSIINGQEERVLQLKRGCYRPLLGVCLPKSRECIGLQVTSKGSMSALCRLFSLVGYQPPRPSRPVGWEGQNSSHPCPTT